MNRLMKKSQNHLRRKNRVRATASGTPERPRLTVYVSNRNITAQIIDDTAHKTIVYSTTVGQKNATGSMEDKAIWVGADIAKKAKAKKIKRVVFDRNGRLYHGRVQALAQTAREEGLEF